MVFSLLHCNFSTAIMFGVITFSLLIVLTFGGLVIPNESSSDKSRILGGSTGNILDFPYFAELIGPNITELRFHHCGGAILSDEVIVSAYSCLVNADAKEWTVIVGSGTSMSGGQTVKGRRIVPHFIYDPYNSENDIGLLFLDTPIDIDNITTKAIDLPEEDEEIPIGTSAVTCGYGRLNDGSYPTNLQKLSLTVTEPEVCAVDAFDRRWDVTDRMLCATNAQAGSGVDIGDNGGPLVADDVLIGITLWGGNFPHAANPGVWTRVPVFVKWIVDNMNKTIGYY